MTTRELRDRGARAPAPAPEPDPEPKVASCAPELAALLDRAGYFPVGSAVRLKGDAPDREWTVAGIAVELHDGANMDLHYRLWCTRPFDWRTVPAALVEPPAEPARDLPGPTVDGPLVWVSPSAGVERTRCGRFEVSGAAETDRALVVRDLWTGETGGSLYTRTAARHWCRHRVPAPALDWTPGHGATEAVGAHCVAAGPGGDARFAVYQERDPESGRPLGQWFGVDARFVRGAWRHSPDFETPDLARLWCETRAACAARPQLVERDPEARDEWGGPLAYQYAPDVALEIPF